MKDPYRAKGREAHPGHLNKVNQAWSQVSKLACVCDPGSRLYRKIVKMEGADHFSCLECGKVVKIDHRGFACCDCNIWNTHAETITRRFELMTSHRKIGSFFKACSY